MTSRAFARSNSMYPSRAYPATTARFESASHPNMYFLGALMHAQDYRESSGGFIHGFRHLVVALHKRLESTRHDSAWPSEVIESTPEAVTEALIARAGSSAAIVSMQGQLVDLLLLPTKTTPARLYTGVPTTMVSVLVPFHTPYATITFTRPRVVNTAEAKAKVTEEFEKSQRDRMAVQKLNERLGGMEEKNETIPMELDAKANKLNVEWGYQEHKTKMLNDHDPFHAERHAWKPEDAERGHTLHPVIEFVCDVNQRHTFHMLESMDHDYSSIAGHLIPLLKQIKGAMSACTLCK